MTLQKETIYIIDTLCFWKYLQWPKGVLRIQYSTYVFSLIVTCYVVPAFA